MKTTILNQSNVELNTTFQPMLTNLQGNILKGHGRNFAQHLFIRFEAEDAAKQWIYYLATNKIKSAWHQLEQAQIRKIDTNHDGGTFYTLSLSKLGYDFLNLTHKAPTDPAFQEGLQARQDKVQDDFRLWESEFRIPTHALLIIADDNQDKLQIALEDVVRELSSFATIHKIQKGEVLKKGDVGIEHFGYADGISQPLYLKEENDKQQKNLQWFDEATLDKVLVEDPGGQSEHSFGSLLVFRKLEQNVIAFKEAEDKLKTVKNESGVDNPELAGAMIVGRFEDGSETVNHSDEIGNSDADQINNDFDYSDDKAGLKCPYHAHIRMTNPRSDVGDFAKQVRITRRGIPFNDVGRDTADLDNDLRDKGVGLLFMCYQSNIENQFEFIQQIWVNNGNIGGRLVGQDGIIGQGTNEVKKHLPSQWGRTDSFNECDFANPDKGFVKMRGGDYFFTPSISFLTSLATIS